MIEIIIAVVIALFIFTILFNVARYFVRPVLIIAMIALALHYLGHHKDCENNQCGSASIKNASSQ